MDEIKTKKSVLAIISLILGLSSSIISVIFSRTSLISPLIGVIAIILAIIALVDIKKTGKSGKWMAIVGLILGIIPIVNFILALIVKSFVSNQVNDAVSQANAKIANLKSG